MILLTLTRKTNPHQKQSENRTPSNPKRKITINKRNERSASENMGAKQWHTEKPPSFSLKRKVTRRKEVSDSHDDSIRLNKYLSNAGICSRRQADEYITAGLVTVNGKIANELGAKVLPIDDVRFNGERLMREKKVYIIMNKPKDHVTSLDEPHAKRTVMDLIKDKCPQRVFPVGRLDRNTTGVLLLTNDGSLADKLMHPKYNKAKIYEVGIDKNMVQSDMQKMLDGVDLEDGFIKADELYFIGEDKQLIGIQIHSGKNQIVRRFFEHFEYKVTKLDRVYFAGLSKKGLQRGHWRYLTEMELGMLQMGSYK